MLDLLLLPLIVYAACGLALSLIVHLVTLFDVKPGPEELLLVLSLAAYIGALLLWIPVGLIMIRMTGIMGAWRLGSDLSVWHAAVAQSPRWMRYMTYALFGYAIITLAILVLAPAWDGNAPRIFSQGVSGHWMLLYSAGLAILTTAYRRGLRNLRPKCVNGHPAHLGDSSCSTCGAPIEGH